MAGDFNSRATEWVMTTTNFRSRRILYMANMDLSTLFRRPGCIGTTPDVALVSEGLSATLTNWKVLEEFTGSDHQYIIFRMVDRSG